MRISKLAIATLLLSPVLALAAVPQTVSFSARVADNGAPVTGTHSFVFKLWNDPTSTDDVLNLKWTEPATGTKDLAVADGVVTTSLGDSVALPTLDSTPLYLEVTMDGTPFQPRLAIQSVPYALRAGSVDWADVMGKTLNCVEEQASANPYTVGANADGSAGIACPAGTTAMAANVYSASSSLWPTTLKAPYEVTICILGCFQLPVNGCLITMHNGGSAAGSFRASCRCCSL